jgi:hypothetical protein
VIVGAIVMVRELGADTLVAGRPGEVVVEKKVGVSGE